MHFGPGLCPGPHWELTMLPRPPNQLCKGHPSPYPTPIGAKDLPPSVFVTHCFNWGTLPQNIFVEPRLAITRHRLLLVTLKPVLLFLALFIAFILSLLLLLFCLDSRHMVSEQLPRQYFLCIFTMSSTIFTYL